MRIAVIFVSLGERPWWPIGARWLDIYCRRWKYDFIVARQPLVTDLQPGGFDRFQNFGRSQKLGIGPFFGIYDRIIQIDDTCIVSPATPSLAEIVPEDAIGCFVEGPYHSGDRFNDYIEKHQEIYERTKPLPKERFYNSGVAVYSRRHAVLFDGPSIPWDKIKSDRMFPTQGYLSHRSEENNFVLHDIGPAFNLVGSQIIRAGDVSQITDKVLIFHLTSAVRDRLGFAKQIDRLFRQRYPGAVPTGI